MRDNSTTKRTHILHGKTNTPEYHVWSAMIQRCTNPKAKYYENYGGRGITVCDRWRNSFVNFMADMGERPEGYTLERRDNGLGYTPDNCYWATRHEQNRNKRNNQYVTLNGETMIHADWAARIGIDFVTLSYRIQQGWSDDEILQPNMGRGHKPIDLTGMRFNHLVAVEYVTNKPVHIWLFRCDCGNLCRLRTSNVKNGHTKSCGCKCRRGPQSVIPSSSS